jgi:hypothetical protein
MLGNTPETSRGWEMFSPPEMLVRAVIIASATTLLPAVFEVILSPSRMATPLYTSVPSVLVKRAMAILRWSCPKMGIDSLIWSMTRWPLSVLYHDL